MSERPGSGADPTCGCCEGIRALTPAPTANRPGLEALVYRVGTHGSFLATMLARLSTLYIEVAAAGDDEAAARLRPLAELTTRSTDDPAIALLDAWATLADVLTFYQERIANEGYLRTATERRSLVELARLVGYAPRPGVAASGYLAFTVDDAYDEVEIATGTRAQSVPEGEGELPQYFETSADFVARASWNAMTPRMSRPQSVYTLKQGRPPTLYLSGTDWQLAAGDPIALAVARSESVRVLFRVTDVTPDYDEERTAVVFELWVREPRGTAVHRVDRSLAPRTVAEEIEAGRRTVDRLLALEDFQVDPASAMAGRASATLRRLREDLAGARTPEEVRGHLSACLEALEPERGEAERLKHKRLAPWLGEAIARLRETESRIERQEPAPTQEWREMWETPEPAAATVLLDGVLTGLAVAPSRPPASAFALERERASVFAAEAALGLDTLAAVTLAPTVRSSLYTAWGAAQVTPPTDLESVEAPRVQALPFGATAPLKTTYDPQTGAISGSEEWDLVERDVDIGVTVLSSAVLAPGQELLAIAWSQEGQPDLDERILLPSDLGVGDSGQIWVEEVIALSDDLQPTLRYRLEDTDGDGQADRVVWVELHLPPPAQRFLTFALSSKDRVGITIDNAFAEIDVAESTPTGLRFHRGLASVQPLILSDTLIAITTRIQTSPTILALDAPYEGILPGSSVALVAPGREPVFSTVLEVRTVSRAAYNLAARVTELLLDRHLPVDSRNNRLLSELRDLTIFAAPEALDLAEEPISDDVGGSEIELGALYDGLEAGRWLIVAGERTDLSETEGVEAAELVMVSAVSHGVEQLTEDGSFDSRMRESLEETELRGDTVHTTLTLATPLAYTYKRDTVTVYGNVVRATHGETRTQVLGSGDATQAWQSFDLSFEPLTHVAAATVAGSESTLAVRVDGVEWDEGAHAALLRPGERAYVTSTDGEETTSTTVTFGNGERGARLPTGTENVAAEYRQGIGTAGNLAAEQISLLATQPLGVQEVVNPLPTTGGADRDDADTIRRNTPIALAALDRLVSVSDYADFALSFAGIGKADALRLSDGTRQVVHLTVAGAADAPIDTGSDLYRNLLAALHRFGDPHQPVEVALRKLKLLLVAARVRVLGAYLWEAVEPALREHLLETFSFERRELGQEVRLSEVIAAIQSVSGVDWVDVDLLDCVPEGIGTGELLAIFARLRGEPVVPVAVPRAPLGEMTRVVRGARQPRPRIPVERARRPLSGAGILPAEIAYLTPDLPDTLLLEEIES